MTLAAPNFLGMDPGSDVPAARPWTLDGLGNQELLEWHAVAAEPNARGFVRKLEENAWWTDEALADLAG